MFENFVEKIQYKYVKHIKRQMLCPACGETFKFDNKAQIWKCNKCQFALSNKVLENDYVFWFCDKCDAFLNNQPNFDIEGKEFTCKCGHKNDITFANIKDFCKICGKELFKTDKFGMCKDCLTENKNKWKKRFKIIGAVAAIAGVAYLIATNTDNSSEESNDALLDYSEYPTCKCGERMTEFDGWAWYTCPECGNSVRIIDGTTTWRNEIFKEGTKELYSDFELADLCRGGELSED